MPAAAHAFVPAGYICDHSFRTAASFQISILVWKAHNRIRITDVDELRIGPGRIKSNAKRARETRREGTHGLGFSIGGYPAKYKDAPWAAFSQKQVAIWRGTKQSRIF